MAGSNGLLSPVCFERLPELLCNQCYMIDIFVCTKLVSSVTFAALYLLQRLKTRFIATHGSSEVPLLHISFMIASKVICGGVYSNHHDMQPKGLLSCCLGVIIIQSMGHGVDVPLYNPWVMGNVCHCTTHEAWGVCTLGMVVQPMGHGVGVP